MTSNMAYNPTQAFSTHPSALGSKYAYILMYLWSLNSHARAWVRNRLHFAWPIFGVHAPNIAMVGASWPRCPDSQSTFKSHPEWHRTGLRCSAARQNIALSGDDHAPVTPGCMRAQYPLPHGPQTHPMPNYHEKHINTRVSIFELPRVKRCISKLCTNPFGSPPPLPPHPKPK